MNGARESWQDATNLGYDTDQTRSGRTIDIHGAGSGRCDARAFEPVAHATECEDEKDDDDDGQV